MIKIFNTAIFVFNLFLFANTIFAQTQPWKKLQSPVNVTLRYLCFVDSLTGWAAGEAGTIIRTTDGGESWDIQKSTVQTFIMDIFFVDKNLGWAITLEDVFPFNSAMLKTTNGGIDWTTENFADSTRLIRTVFFFDSLHGFIGGSNIGYTTDAGNSWTSSEIDSNLVSGFPVYNFEFYNRQFGFACGGRIDLAGVVWRTTNAGLNWFAQGVSSDEVFDLFIFDSLNALSFSGDPEGLYPIGKITTTDAGINWDYESLPFFGMSFAIDFRTYNEGWSASGYKFLLTTDRGETWSEFETTDSSVVYDLQFTDARNGYAVGQDGVILKFDPSLVGIKDNLPPIKNFDLYQNYPNPFNPSTNIGFQITDRGFVSLKIYDVLGNEIATLVNEEKPAGTYNINFDARGLPSGMYFYTLIAGNYTQIKKMILLK